MKSVLKGDKTKALQPKEIRPSCSPVQQGGRCAFEED
jgi:hypothetical protein